MVEEEQIIEDEEFRQSMGYGYPQEAEKNNPIAFFKELIAGRSNIKSANLSEDELGGVRIPVRTNLEISEYCKAMKMGAFANCFKRDAQITLGTSLSRDGFLVKTSVTSTRESRTEMTKKGNSQPNKGWFGSRKGEQPAGYM
tara:strand:+ start:2938 stop:3363 length:426 start_codon:yes stop_codon:yes gene_type:complete